MGDLTPMFSTDKMLNDLLDCDTSNQTAGLVLTSLGNNLGYNLQAGGGGGGVTITGVNQAAIFKNGTNGDTYTGGITRSSGTANYAINLNTTAYRVGIGGASNALNPVNTLEVYGDARIKGIAPDTNEIVISSDNIGNIIGGSTLRLYSNNSLVPEDIVEVDGFNRTCSVGGTMRTLQPTAFDFPNSSIEDGLYKIKLQQGMNLWVGAPFDPQNQLSNTTTAFPVGQVVEYQNNQPIQDWRCIARLANNATLAPAVPYQISNFGTFGAFVDRMIYDPMGCRSRLAGGTQWQWCGAPSVLRVATNKFMINVKWYVDGVWALADPVNQLDIYVTQYRTGALLRQFLVSTSGSPSAAYHTSGERTFMGFANYGEDFDCIRDDYQVEIVNFGANAFTIGTTQCEFKFILAQ